MRLMVALENRFYEGPSGHIYSNNVFDYSVWGRYLQVFDEVVVFARVGRTDEEPSKPCSDGAGVSFYRLPMYIGPRQYLRRRRELASLASEAVTAAEAFVLRVPGTMGSLLYKPLRARGIGYGVEVVGDAAEAIDNCGANPIFKPLMRSVFARNQRRQCRDAAAAAYVSEHYLQSLYPCGGWTTYYSSIDLHGEALLSAGQLAEKLARLREPFDGKRGFVMCHAGTMDARYKGQEILIEAVARCIGKGFDVRLVLMGDGQFRPLYEQKARQLGIGERVAFLGNVPPGQAVRDQYDRADLLVFPSLTEGLPKAMVEAMARGLPCVASDVGGIPELLEGEFLAKPGDADELAFKIEKILSSKDQIGHHAEKNWQKSKEYKYEVLNSRRIEFYERVKDISKTL